MDARPTTHDVVAVFMDRDDDRQSDDKERDGPKSGAKGWEQTGQIQGLSFTIGNDFIGTFTGQMVRLLDRIKGHFGIYKAAVR